MKAIIESEEDIQWVKLFLAIVIATVSTLMFVSFGIDACRKFKKF